MLRRVVTQMSACDLGCQRRRCFYRRKVYRNAASEFFFTQFDKGFDSVWFTLGFFAFCGTVAYQFFNKWIIPNIEAGRLKERAGYQLRIPFADSHNAFWNFKPAQPDYRHPASLTMMDDEIMKQPGLIATVDSELADPNGAKKTIFVMETQELDPVHKDDVFYRSVHYVNKAEVEQSASLAKPNKRATVPLGRTDREQDEHIHGLVKCRNVTEENRCVPETQAVHDEVTRKLMIGIIPAHILRDMWSVAFPYRYTMSKQVESKVLVCGLRGGVLARTLATAFPHFKVDVCEPDGGLVKVNRQFLGFKESTNLRVFIGDFITYFRDSSVKGMKYDLIFLDCEDSRGRIPSFLGRLEFINNLRKVLADQGTLVFNIPNKQRNEVTAMVDNWRIAFGGQPIVLIHCKHDRNTILMAFNEYKAFGAQVMGTLPNAETLRQIATTQRTQFKRSMDIDLSAEITDDNFQCIEPHQTRYELNLQFDDGAAAPAKAAAHARTSGESLLNQQPGRFERFMSMMGLSGAATGQ